MRALARQRERALDVIAVGLDRDLLLAKVNAQRMVAALGALTDHQTGTNPYFEAAKK